MPLAMKALDLASSSLPSKDPKLGWCFNEAAECHHQSRSFDKALGLYESAADIFRHHLPKESISLSTVNHHLALLYNDIEQNDKAVELMTESIKISKQNLPENHHEIAESLVTLGGILFYKNDFDEAVVHLESGLSILREELPSSPFTATGLYYLAFIEMERNQLVEAQRHATQCLRLRQEIFLKDDNAIICAQELVHEIEHTLATL
ncbi:nephrocystin-3-like [Corticium candelabrum]|uniref:nephrocystin-3-like n=1 Tax=Corticium candelabrum TaxID=121492 RepID=UPI002E25FB12|nr:nephrocystin-3-like [Corticium candelabrum]